MQYSKSMVSALAGMAALGGVMAAGSAQAVAVGCNGTVGTVCYNALINGNTVATGAQQNLQGVAGVQVGNDSLTFTWTAIEDPTIGVTVSAIDGGAASTFTLYVTLFFNPVQGPYVYDLSGSVSLTDLNPQSGVQILTNPNAAPELIFTGRKGLKETPAVNTVIDSIVGSSPVFNGGGSFTHPAVPVAATGTDCDGVNGPVNCSSMSLQIDFKGSGGGDLYGLTGQWVNKPAPVPVPAALPLMISAIAAVGLVGARRKA
jgi:hypothetical protein